MELTRARPRTSTHPWTSTRERRRARTPPRRRDASTSASIPPRLPTNRRGEGHSPPGPRRTRRPASATPPGARHHNPTPSTSSRARTTPATPRLAPGPAVHALDVWERPPAATELAITSEQRARAIWMSPDEKKSIAGRHSCAPLRGWVTNEYVSFTARAASPHPLSLSLSLSLRAAYLSSSLSASATPSRFGLLSATHSTTSLSTANP